MQVEVLFPIMAWVSGLLGLGWILEVFLFAPGRYRRWVAQAAEGKDAAVLRTLIPEPDKVRLLGNIFLLSLIPLLYLSIRKSVDFAWFLMLACLLSGVVYLFDFFVLKKLRLQLKETLQQKFSDDAALLESGEKEPLAIEYARSFFPILFIVLVLRSFLIEPYQIPSGSMLPTLQVGDYIAVKKFAYGLKLPITGTKLLPLGEPEAGDIIVFKSPEDGSTTLIKRLIAVPGDKVRFDYEHSRLWINGEEVTDRYITDGMEPEAGFPVRIYEEQTGDVKHIIYKARYGDGNRPSGWIPEEGFTVPDGKYFMMGDNRDNSLDGRFFGLVDETAIMGRAFAVWVHWPSFTSLPDFSKARWLK